MSHLIDPNTYAWNYHFVSQVLNSDVASSICNVPLSLLGVADKPTWKPAKNEVFSIKSTYAMDIMRERRK